jgi:hypothetical protein
MNKFEKEYLKYKKKYIKLKYDYGNDYDTDLIDTDELIEENLQYEETLEDTTDDTNIDEELEIFMEKLLKLPVVDIGIDGLARGKLVKIYDVNEEFTDMTREEDGKILKIETQDDFDKFTAKYGYINKKDLLIKWDFVADKYKGFFLADSIPERDVTVLYKNKTYDTWIKKDYDIKDVVIFDKIPVVVKYKTIKKPFKAMISESYMMDEEDFTRINDKYLINKILLIADVKAFDTFTNKYGSVNKDKIKINWEKVRLRYKGIYLEKGIKQFRYNNVYLNNQKYKSWWRSKNNELEEEIVYVFL